jgi:hypothetical protein
MRTNSTQQPTANISTPAPIGQLTNVPIAAGQSTTISGSGDMVYVAIATAPCNIRTRGSKGNSTYATFTVGTGIRGQPFDSVDVQNPNTIPIVVQVWTGLSQYVDNRLILANASIPNIVFPTCPTPNSVANINFKDLSGGGFADANGKNWLALYRVAIVVCNVDSGATFLVQPYGSVVANGPAIAAVYPLTSWTEAISGDYCMNVGGANINVIAHEIYAAIPA